MSVTTSFVRSVVSEGESYSTWINGDGDQEHGEAGKKPPSIPVRDMSEQAHRTVTPRQPSEAPR